MPAVGKRTADVVVPDIGVDMSPPHLGTPGLLGRAVSQKGGSG
jgi:hypothetical protein